MYRTHVNWGFIKLNATYVFKNLFIFNCNVCVWRTEGSSKMYNTVESVITLVLSVFGIFYQKNRTLNELPNPKLFLLLHSSFPTSGRADLTNCTVTRGRLIHQRLKNT